LPSVNWKGGKKLKNSRIYCRRIKDKEVTKEIFRSKKVNKNVWPCPRARHP